MHSLAHILVVAATDRELAPPAGWRTLVCGVGPVDAAANTASAIAAHRPKVILHVGIAGARRGSGLMPPALVIGDCAEYCDLNIPETWAPHTVVASTHLVDAAQRAVPNATVLRIGTSAQVGGTLSHRDAVTVEAMEGFAVLRAAQLADVLAIEVRAISNFIDEPDRRLWQFDEAFGAITSATPRLVAEIESCLR